MEPVLFVKEGALKTAPGTKILKAREYAAWWEAADLLAKAEEEAKRIVTDAGEAYRREKTRGYRDGLLEGKMNLSAQMMDTVAKTVDYFAEIEKKVVDIVTIAVRKIIGDMEPGERIAAVVGNVLTLARNQTQVTLRVSAGQVETVRERLDGIMAAYPGIRFVDVVADGRLKEGGCILETEMGIVDAGVDVQIEAIRRSLMKSFKRR
jgi:type III secretion protein L